MRVLIASVSLGAPQFTYLASIQWLEKAALIVVADWPVNGGVEPDVTVSQITCGRSRSTHSDRNVPDWRTSTS